MIFQRLFAASRFFLLVAVAGSALLAIALLGYGGVAVVKLIVALFAGEVAGKMLAFEAIKLVDLFLLAAVMHLIALGLCELFIHSEIPVPEWLQIRSIDDLKNKLLRVVVLVLAVTFLGQAIGGAESRALLEAGLSIAAVIVAIGYFLRSGDAGH